MIAVDWDIVPIISLQGIGRHLYVAHNKEVKKIEKKNMKDIQILNIVITSGAESKKVSKRNQTAKIKASDLPNTSEGKWESS